VLPTEPPDVLPTLPPEDVIGGVKVMAPLLAVQFDLPGDSIQVLFLSLLLGTPVLSLIGAIGAALTIGLRGGGALVSLLVLPLYIPVLIFGAGAVGAEASGLGASAPGATTKPPEAKLPASATTQTIARVGPAQTENVQMTQLNTGVPADISLLAA